jgi:hypothetical protein
LEHHFWSVPQYFFNIVVRGRMAIADPDGDQLPGDKEARRHAKMIARDMLANHIWYNRGLEHWAFEITNGAGRHVGVVPFSGIFSKTGRLRSRRIDKTSQ